VSNFIDNLKQGQIGESIIAEWFKSKGYNVLPIYEVEIDSGKGPRLFTPTEQLIATDMFVFNYEKAFWIEAKHKTAFSWHRISGQWVTGIDLKHYEDYCKLQKSTKFPVWLIFLHKGGQAKDSPVESPKGLFGNDLNYLMQNENHRSDKWGKYGMVYWAIKDLKRLY